MSQSKGSILIVDDDAFLRNSLAQVFTYLRYRTRCAMDGIEALIEMREEVPDILLSDLNMPNMSGLELLSVVRRRFPAVRVIAMSGMLSDDAIPCGVAADAFYQKDGGIAALLELVDGRPWPQRKPVGAPELIWIQRNDCDFPGSKFVTIACPDCLRTFHMPTDNTSNRIIDTRCRYCHCMILYAVFDPSSVALPPSWAPARRSDGPVMDDTQSFVP